MICNFFNKVRFLTNKLKLLIFMKKPFLHLHLSLLFLMGCVFLLPSCIEDKAEDAAHRLVVSKVDVELIQTGMLNTGSKASFDVLANRGYVITSDAEWLDVDKPTGKGRVSVTLEAKPNETAGERTGHLPVTSGKLSTRITYYSENFDWIAVYGGADCVGLGSQNGAKNIYSTGDALQKFGEAGLQDYNPVGKTMYACAGYFKMGATDKQTGIILPALKIGRKKASNVELTFETCPNIGGSGKAAAETVTDEIEGYKFELDKGVTLKDGKDVTVIATGLMVQMALKAREMMAAEGVSVRVIDMHTIKPLDGELVRKAVLETGCIVTSEEHSIIGGLGGAVAEFLSENCPTPLVRHGVNDAFGRSGTANAVLEAYGLTPEVLCDKIREALAKKH